MSFGRNRTRDRYVFYWGGGAYIFMKQNLTRPNRERSAAAQKHPTHSTRTFDELFVAVFRGQRGRNAAQDRRTHHLVSSKTVLEPCLHAGSLALLLPLALPPLVSFCVRAQFLCGSCSVVRCACHPSQYVLLLPLALPPLVSFCVRDQFLCGSCSVVRCACHPPQYLPLVQPTHVVCSCVPRPM
jgi:hypothetical protein